jgi:hypothetical protein
MKKPCTACQKRREALVRLAKTVSQKLNLKGKKK